MIKLGQLLSSEHRAVANMALTHNHLHMINKTLQDDGILYNFMTSSFSVTRDSYLPRIFISETDTSKINRQTLCKVFCNCQNFKFAHSVQLHNQDALQDYIPENLVLPTKHSNGCCKHVEACILYILKYEVKS